MIKEEEYIKLRYPDLRKEIKEQRNTKSDPILYIIVLLISIILFIYWGVISFSVTDLTILIIVLFIHELGHLMGMKVFRYKNLRMFFIPFFGAAASGEETDPGCAKKAIIALLGPVPGIILGIVALIIYSSINIQIFLYIALMLLVINGFNLLPFYPLDGGRFFNDILFTRNVYLELIFRSFACIAMGLIAILLRSWALGLLAFIIFTGLRKTYVTAKLTGYIKRDYSSTQKSLPDKISNAFIVKVIRHVENYLKPSHRNSRTVARFVLNIWEKTSAKPISALGTIGFILIYTCIMVILIAAPTGVLMPSLLFNQVEWQELKSEPGRFSTLMPDAVIEEVRDTTFNEDNLTRHIHKCKNSLFVCFVAYIDFPEKYLKDGIAQLNLSSIHKKYAENTKGKIIHEQPLILDGYEGRETKIKRNNGSVFFIRSYIVGSRLYDIYIGMKKDFIYFIKRNTVKKYLDSFRLI